MVSASQLTLRAITLLAFTHTALSDRIGQPFDRGICQTIIQDGFSNNITSITDEENFFILPVEPSRPVLHISACKRICGDSPERKRDCTSRVKDWMWPVLLLLVAVEPAAVLTSVWTALGLYFFALGDPITMFRSLLGRIRHMRRCREAGREMLESLQRQRREMLDTMQRRRDAAGRRRLLRESRGMDMSENYGMLLWGISEVLGDLDSAKGALRHALLRQTQLSEREKDAIARRAAASLRSFGRWGVAAAWIAVAVCIVDLLFLIIQPLQQPWLEPPSGAKIASAAAFSWLMPLVLLHAYYGERVDSGRVGEEVFAFLRELNRGRIPCRDRETEAG